MSGAFVVADIMSAIDFSALFTPLKLGNATLANRIVMPAMGIGVCKEGVPGDDHADYYARRAQGGAGTILTEGVYIDHHSSGDNPTLGRFHGEQALAGWKNVAAKVHAAGGICMPELWHVGLIYKTADTMTGGVQVFRPELAQVSPSGFIAPGTQVCDGMTQTQIDQVIDAFARGASEAMRLGFDGLEIHGAHGYLIDQFFWSVLNKRTDHYGGSARRRGQFAADIIAECRRRIGPGVPIVLRISQWKLLDYNARIADTPRELQDLLAPSVEAGVDLFDCSQRRFWEPAFEDSDLNLAGWVKKLTGVPTMTVGSVGLDCDMPTSFLGQTAACNPESLEELMRRFDRGEFDLVGIGRAIIAEPDWARIVRSGQIGRLKPFEPPDFLRAKASTTGRFEESQLD
ncbi:MAG TPA: NADH:flavin oxidoreductase [Steroidobacteraceae bacterium]|nr:NADH:flavin oxidoreductase [Steroidobacteraceae bacterium]